MFNILSLLNSYLATTSSSESENYTLIGALLILALVFLLVSKIGEEICTRLNLSPVLGQLLGGIVVGISGLHLLVFSTEEGEHISTFLVKLLQIVTGGSSEAVEIAYQDQLEVVTKGLANLGVIALLFSIGLESDLRELIRVAPQAATVAITGVLFPFTLGTLGLITLFHMPILPAVFAGAALTATSIGITAKVLQEIGFLKSEEGQIIIGAAVLDDILGVIILAVIVSLLETGTVEAKDILSLLIRVTVLMISAVILSRFWSPVFTALVEQLKTKNRLLISAIIFMLLLTCFANAIHLEAILGAFLAGLILGETDKRHELQTQFQPIVDVVTPAFFVSIGAKTDLSVLNPVNPSNREGLIVAVFLVVTAIIGKVMSGFLVPAQTSINRLAIGVGMVPRGEVGLVFVGLGSSTKVLSKSLEVAIIVTVIVTTLVAPLLLQFVLKKTTNTAVDNIVFNKINLFKIKAFNFSKTN